MKEEVLVPELISELKNLDLYSDEFKKIIEYTEIDDKKINEFLFEGKVPDKDYISKFRLSNIGIQLSLLQFAKKLAAKLQLIEKYFSKIEDIIYSEETLNEMSPKDLISLYSGTRMLFEKNFDMLTKVQKEIDFDEIETFVKILNTKRETEENSENNSDSSIDEEDIEEIMQMIKQKKKEKLEK